MPMRIGTPLPELDGATVWLNGDMPAHESLIGSPVLIHFWAVSCHICHENLPTITRWREEYGPKGLKVVAIHMPRQETDTEVNRVQEMVSEMNITEPCGVDNLHTVAERFQNEYVPAYFLFDREGNLRSRAAGDAGTSLLEGAIKRQFESASI
jgi:thiol-disulfide isomerase/thioredoxin